MNVETTRFGPVKVDDNRIITFPAGLLGFAKYTQYALLQPSDEGVFYWLQSIESPELAFVVTDPSLWVNGFQASIRTEQMAEMGLASIDDAQVFCIVNKYDRTLTANLQGPLIVNTYNRTAMQLVLAEKRWTTRHAIVDVSQPLQAATA